MTEENKGLSRRTVVKGAAWSVPVIAAAVATPLAAASVGNAVVSLPTSGALLDLRLFGGDTTIAAQLLPSGPDDLRIQNGAGEIPGPIDVTFVVSSPVGLDVSLGGRPHGIGVREIAGATRTSWTETPPSGGLPLLQRPYTVESTFTVPGPIASAANFLASLTYNYSDQGGFLGLGVIATFNVAVTVTQAGTTVGTAAGSFDAPLNVTVL